MQLDSLESFFKVAQSLKFHVFKQYFNWLFGFCIM